MGYLTLFVLAVLGQTSTAKSWGGYHYPQPSGNYHYPTGNHHNFDYNKWCHSAGGWDDNHFWVDSNESSEEDGNKNKPLRCSIICHTAGGWDGGGWENSSSEESQEWRDFKHRPMRAGDWDNSESSEDSSSEESQECHDSKDRLIRSTTTKTTVVINKTNTDIEETSSISLRQSSSGTPSPLEVLLCLRVCPITSEYNPVCGTDSITYWNPGRLQCAITCGINVSLQRPSPCPSDNLGSTEPTNSATTLSPQVLATCMRSCSVTSEYNPVCGTDYITYNNPSRLECAKGCGKPITMLVASRCPSPDQLTSTTTTTSTPRSVSSTTPLTPSSSSAKPEPTPTPTAGPTKFTIPQNILDEIFNDNSTTESVPDFSLDERYEK